MVRPSGDFFSFFLISLSTFKRTVNYKFRRGGRAVGRGGRQIVQKHFELQKRVISFRSTRILFGFRSFFNYMKTQRAHRRTRVLGVYNKLLHRPAADTIEAAVY